MINAIFDRPVLMPALFIVLALRIQLLSVPPARADNNCETNFDQSGIAWTGDTVVIVASNNVTSGGNLYYFWQKTGTGGWNRELVASANGGTCPGNCTGWCQPVPWGYISNAIAWTGDSVVIAAVDQRDGGLYYWYQAKGTTAWHQQQIAPGPPGCCSFYGVVNGVTTPEILGYVLPSIAWTGSSVVVASCDREFNLHYWFQEKFKTTWYHELVAKGDCNYQPSIAWTGASVIIAAPCHVGLCYYWQAAGAAGWNREVVDSNPYTEQQSIAWNGKAVIISAVVWPTEFTSMVYYWWQEVGTQTWHKQQVMYGPPAANIWGMTSIAAAGDSVVIAASMQPSTDSDGNALYYWWEPFTMYGDRHINTYNWTLENLEPSKDYSVWTDARSIAWTGASVIMSVTTACGDLDYWWQRVGTTNWNKQRVATDDGWPPGTCD
jgi:hypothetical protein